MLHNCGHSVPQHVANVTKYHPSCSSNAAKYQRVLLQFYPHPKYCKCCSCHTYNIQTWDLWEIIGMMFCTTRLDHERKISGHTGLDTQSQCHHWECHSSTSLTGHTCYSGPEYHCDGEQVPLREIGKVIMLHCLEKECKSPPCTSIQCIVKYFIYFYSPESTRRIQRIRGESGFL